MNNSSARKLLDPVRRCLVAAATLLVLLHPGLAVRSAIAQEAKPCTPTRTRCFPVTTVYRDRDGDELATITVTDYEEITGDDAETQGSGDIPRTPPPDGFHFEILFVVVENTGDAALAVDRSQFVAFDVFNGFLYAGDDVSADVFPSRQPLADATLQPGESKTGIVVFLTRNGEVVDNVRYRPEPDRFIAIANVSSGGKGGGGDSPIFLVEL